MTKTWQDSCEDAWKECEKLQHKLSAAESIVKAVAHIGVDFGYGTYELEGKWIDKARAYLEQGE